MYPVKRNLFRILSFILATLLFVSVLSLSVFAATDTAGGSGSTSSEVGGGTTDTPGPSEDLRKQAAYTFSDAGNLTADVGGKYPLSTKTFGANALSSVEGTRDLAMKGYVTVDPVLLSEAEQFSVGFWTKFSLASAKNKNTLFRVSGKGGEVLDLSFAVEGKTLLLRLNADDGSRVAFCSFDVSDLFGDEESWHHFAFTYRKAGSASLLQLFVDGTRTSSSASTSYVDLSAMDVSAAAFQGVTVDELYITDFALEAAKIASMKNQSVATFYASEKKEIESGTSSGGDNPSVDLPVDAYVYPWAAYLFEKTSPSWDSNGGAIAAETEESCARMDSAKLKSKFGYVLIRREGTAPAAYLKLDPRLVQAQTNFTFTAWVYRSGNTDANEECLLDLNGKGTLRFAPYAVDRDGSDASYLEYTDSRGNVQHSEISGTPLASPLGQWVHYALTYAHDGKVTVYVNGVSVAVFSTGVSPAALNFSDARVLTGCSSSDGARTALDEVYFTPRTLSAAEIRKIHYYGLEKYTTEVLPDPGDSGSGSGTVNPNAPDAFDLAEDAYSKTGVISGFIGTTFDERVAAGRDYNGTADATITGERLTSGIASYALSLDGASSFLRYPMGILDGADSLTISLSYRWDGHTSASSRSQRLFDFSRKVSSVAQPTAYIYLETGVGFGGMKFAISDGITTTVLPYDYNAVNTWTRVTVVIEHGRVALFLDGEEVASAATAVDLASICPNYCYVGRSGVKGDPLFKGSVDEIYISNSAMPSDQVGKWQNGIAAAMNDSGDGEGESLADTLIRIAVVAGIILVLAVVVVLIIVIVKRDKRPKAEMPAAPVPRRREIPSDDVPLGPRSARRARAEEDSEDVGSTVQFRKLHQEDLDGEDPEATSTFRKVDPRPDSSASEETVAFRKPDADGSDGL